MQNNHNKSRSLKSKVIACAIAAVLVVSSAVPAIITGFNSANAASVDDEATGATNVTTIGNTQDNIFWTNATYFDYLTDDEKNSSWLTGIKKYGTGFNGSIDEWYPYYAFNNKIKSIADSNSAWSTPLYFGNFCNTSGAYATSRHHIGSTWNSGYDEAVAQTTRFNYAANNSNGLNNYNQSYQGLMQSTLDSNGNLMATSSLKAPYFDESQLGDYAKVFKSRFPFRSYVENGVTKYEFDSTGAKDNVYFTWNGTTPTQVNYGAGTSYGVKDGIDYFMNPAEGQHSGYGIFPFNNRNSNSGQTRYIYLNKDDTDWGDTYCYFFNSSGTVGTAWPGSKMSTYSGGGTNLRIAIPDGATSCVFNNNNGAQTTNINDLSKGAYWLDSSLNVNEWSQIPADAGAGVSENLDYGFGIKTEMNFRVPQGGIDSAGNDIKFSYSGDDDLWVYITDTTTNQSQLVLDLGGNHKQATGEINFKTKQSKANDVYGRGSVTTSFNYDYSKTYKMSIFYMERGMLESNCKMAFTMVPLGNNVIVTEKINTADVNAGIKDAVTAASTFGFDVYDGNTSKGHYDLGDGGMATETKCVTGDYVHVVQTHPQTVLTYTTNYDIYNTANKTGTKQSGTTTTSANIRLLNPSGDTYDFAEVEADYVNTPAVAPVTITKTVTGLNTGETDNTDFDGKVEVSLDNGSSWASYPLTYTFNGSTYTHTLTSAGKLATNAKLRNGRTLTFAGLPQGAKVRFTEDATDEEHSFVSVSGGTSGIPVGANGGAITVTNQKNRPGEITKAISVKKTLDGQNYNGTLFKFRLEGLNIANDPAANAKDTTGVTPQEKVSASNGTVNFDALTFGSEGVYRYFVYEDPNYLAQKDALQHTTYAQDILQTSSNYVATITVTRSGITLTASNPVFTRTNKTSASDITAADLGGASLNTATFTNVVQSGSVQIEKNNQAGERVQDITFALYKLDEIEVEDLETSSDVEKYDYIVANCTKVSEAVTDTNGVARFNDLKIYENGYINSSAPVYQNYALVEIGGNSDYRLNKTPQIFKFPTQGQYNYTFSYENGMIKNPNTAGNGMMIFRTVGLILIGLALLTLAGFVIYKKKFSLSRAKNARHYKK